MDFDQLLSLVALEAQAQAERSRADLDRLTAAQAERAGLSLTDLIIKEESMGLGGRWIVELAKRTEGLELPWSRLRPGSPVMMDELRGVVLRRNRSVIAVAFGTIPEETPEGPLRLDLSADEITTKREQRALHAAKASRFAKLTETECEELEPVEADLDPTQREAVAFALASKDVALIHGPPGTGKTRTVCALIVEAVARGERVLACAPSNTAVDNMLERLSGVRVVRLGHPARVQASLVDHTLDAQVERHPSVRQSRKLVKEAWALRRKADRWTRAKPAPGEKRALREEARRLLNDARQMERSASQKILEEAEVILATTSVDTELLGPIQFDRVVIDEACQCTEPSAWIPILCGDRVVLAGDHQQLPPTVVSVEAERGGLARSLFERWHEELGNDIVRQLGVQYRMHEAIMGFSNERFYEGSLVAHESVAHHGLPGLPPLTFIDTAGAGWDETVEPDGESRLNEGEAALVGKRVSALLAAGLDEQQIGVITPYAAQVRHLRTLVETVEVDTVDGFQGREKDVIVISLVRSNADQEIGFLSDLRRMNVAMTRARKHLLVIGDSATISGDPFYADMIEWVELHDGYTTVWDLNV